MTVAAKEGAREEEDNDKGDGSAVAAGGRTPEGRNGIATIALTFRANRWTDGEQFGEGVTGPSARPPEAGGSVVVARGLLITNGRSAGTLPMGLHGGCTSMPVIVLGLSLAPGVMGRSSVPFWRRSGSLGSIHWAPSPTSPASFLSLWRRSTQSPKKNQQTNTTVTTAEMIAASLWVAPPAAIGEVCEEANGEPLAVAL